MYSVYSPSSFSGVCILDVYSRCIQCILYSKYSRCILEYIHVYSNDVFYDVGGVFRRV